MRWHTFRWIQEHSAGMDAEHLLRRYGIPVANRCIPAKSIPGAECGFDVPRHQAAFAEYLLCRAGWVLVTPLIDERNRAVFDRARAEGATRPAGGGKIKRQGIAAKFYGFMDEAVGVGAAGREQWQPPQTRMRRPPNRQSPAVRPRPSLIAWLQKLFLGD